GRQWAARHAWAVPRERWGLPEGGQHRRVHQPAQRSRGRRGQRDRGNGRSPRQDDPGQWAAWQPCPYCLELSPTGGLNMSPLPPLVDPVALGAYLAQELPCAEASIEVERIRGGHSNETFYIRRGDDEWVLRRPPRGPLLPTAHDVAREYRVLQALAQTNVP